MTTRESVLPPEAIITARIAVTHVLQRPAEIRGLPLSITVDNRPKFASSVLDALVYPIGVRLSFIRPGNYEQKAYRRCVCSCLRL